MGFLDRFRFLDRTPTGQPAGLISVLLDAAAPLGDRGDAAMDLGAHDEPEAARALLQVASDPATDEDLADSCGESLAEIWSRRSAPPAEAELRVLIPAARQTAITTLGAFRPDWREGLAGGTPPPAAT